VTKNGAVVLNMISERMVQQSNISVDDARKIAARFLQEAGYESMQESYYIRQDNILTVNYAYVQEGVICYTDLIKVSVALDNGEVSAFETLGYVMSHTQRDIPQQQVDEATAREKVPDELTILSHCMAIIPTDGKYEKLCHEFKCETDDGEHYIIYVNASTGEEEKILILLEDENGTLVI
jgi:germination protein YpeB